MVAMSVLVLIGLLSAGVAAGFINTVAGGGSLLTLPALMLAGLPADVANGKLHKPFDIDMKPTRSFYLLSTPGSARTREVSIVQNWLLDEAGRSFD